MNYCDLKHFIYSNIDKLETIKHNYFELLKQLTSTTHLSNEHFIKQIENKK